MSILISQSPLESSSHPSTSFRNHRFLAPSHKEIGFGNDGSESIFRIDEEFGLSPHMSEIPLVVTRFDPVSRTVSVAICLASS